MRWRLEKSSSLGMPMSPQEISKMYKCKSLGIPKAPPSSSTKYQVIFQDTIFLLLHILCVVLGAYLFLFLVFFCFVCCNKWLDPIMFVLERVTLRFHCSEHSSSHSYCPASVLFLLVLCLALVFHSYFVQSLLVFFSYIWLALWYLLIIIFESCFK
jgi:hypothetical protein